MKLIPNILLAGSLLINTSVLFAADEASYSKLAGIYTGTYRFEMNTNDPMMVEFSDFEEKDLFKKITPSGTRYAQLGFNSETAIWKWDFNKLELTWGGSRLFALGNVRLHYRLYNQNMTDKKAGDIKEGYKIITPAIDTYPNILSSDEITMPIIDNKDGTYSVDFSKKIYFDAKGYPIAKTTALFKITLEDNDLKIITLDSETDGGSLDGIPGARIDGAFPFIVQPSYYSVKMYKETELDSNSDGITDLESKLLNLDKNVADSDGDAIGDLEEMITVYSPFDKDKDGIADYIEKGNDANNQNILGNLENDIISNITFVSTHPIDFDGSKNIYVEHNPKLKPDDPSNHYIKGPKQLPILNDKDIEIRYKVLELNGRTTDKLPANPTFKIIFDEEVPKGFKVYSKKIEDTEEYTDEEELQAIFEYNYRPLEYTVSENNKELTIPISSIFSTPFISRAFVFELGEKTKAYLVESSIKGLSYNNNGYEGKTLSDGSFYYGAKAVEFSIGDILLGTLDNVNKDGKIFIQDIVDVERQNIGDKKVLKVAQFLYSLDSNLDTDEIEISDEMFEKFQNEKDDKTDILSSSFDIESVLNTKNIEIKPISEVKEKLMKTLITEKAISFTKAYFIDSAVQGLQYKNANVEGKTNSDGSFDYVDGEVEFFIGDISIGKISSINSDGKIFIQDIVGVERTNIKDEKVLKIAQFLQSLDSDSSTNEIEITNQTFEKFQSNDDSKTNILSNSFNVEDTLTSNNITVKEMDDVKDHLNKTLIDNNIIEEKSTSTSSGSGGSFSWLLLLSLFGFSFFKSRKNKI